MSVQLDLFPRRVRFETWRQGTEPNGRDFVHEPETVTGTVVLDRGAYVLVRFDGPREPGSCRGCTLLVDADEVEAA